MKEDEEEQDMHITMEPIGFVHTDLKEVPRHWSVSDVIGKLVIDEKYIKGLKDIKSGQRIVVIFCFHKNQNFTPQFLSQRPSHRKEELGVFSICSPKRPNPIGMSVLEVVRINAGVIDVKGLDMLDGTPILDIKPFIEDKHSCQSYKGQKS